VAKPRRLIFSDEFEVAGPLDPAKWDHELGSLRNHELQCYTGRPENVRAENGKLVLEARREQHQGHSFTSASILTRGRFEFRYGRVEVRVKLPGGRGTWPAVWLVGVNEHEVRWPACGEIDIVENVGFAPSTVWGAAHMTAYSHATGNPKVSALEVERPWEVFHDYALEWTADRIDWELDGRLFFTFENERTGVAAWPFDGAQYLIIALAIGGDLGGQHGIDESCFPQRLEVEHVRVYAPA
jgi:beta-glucanase (GH16 family)